MVHLIRKKKPSGNNRQLGYFVSDILHVTHPPRGGFCAVLYELSHFLDFFLLLRNFLYQIRPSNVNFEHQRVYPVKSESACALHDSDPLAAPFEIRISYQAI